MTAQQQRFIHFPLRLRAAMVLLLAGCQAFAADDPSVRFDSKDQELLYYWGTTFGEQVAGALIGDPADVEWIVKGLRDRAANRSPAFPEENRSLLNNYLVRHRKDMAGVEAAASREYLARIGREPGVVVTASGLVYQELAPGTGARPARDSTVRVHYVGSFRDGREFDNSRSRGAPLQSSLDRVIPCWTEALPMMKVGGRARFTCPPELAYGEQGNARIPGGSALTFEVELLEVVR